MEDGLNKLLDRTGRQILSELKENARISFSELAKKINLSPPAVAERVKKLEEAGIITGYHAHIRSEKMDGSLQAFVRLRTTADKYPKIIQIARELPEVVECYHVTGNDSFLMKIELASHERLEQIISHFSPFGETFTTIVLSAPVHK